MMGQNKIKRLQRNWKYFVSMGHVTLPRHFGGAYMTYRETSHAVTQDRRVKSWLWLHCGDFWIAIAMGDMHKKTEAMLRAVLISSPRGVPVYRLDREYKAITFQSIPFRELGFGSLESYLRSIPHVASFATLSGETVIKGVASEADKHVAKLIAKQKKPKLKKVLPPRKPSFPSRRLASSHMSTATKATTPRFIPPRMQSRFQSGTSTNLVGLRRIILNNTADNDSRSAKKPPSPRAKIPPNKRNVTLTPTPLMGASSKSQSLLSENVSGSKRTVNMEGNNDSSHASPEVKKKITPATGRRGDILFCCCCLFFCFIC